MLTSIFGFDNKSLTISILSDSTAKYNAFRLKRCLFECYLNVKI